MSPPCTTTSDPRTRSSKHSSSNEAAKSPRAERFCSAAKRITARTLAAAFVDPVADIALDDGEAWVRFIASLINSTHPAMTLVTQGFFEQARRFTTLLEALHPDWPTEKVMFRLAQAMTLTFRVLGDLQGVQRTIAVSKTELSRAEVVRQLLDLVTAILRG
jgi:hypothetical protein